MANGINLVMGMGAAGVARRAFSGTGLNQDILRSMTEAAVLVVARHGTVDDLITNLSIAAMGASMRSRVSLLGTQHTTHLHQSYQAQAFKRQLAQTLKTTTRVTAGQLEAQGVSISKKNCIKRLTIILLYRGMPLPFSRTSCVWVVHQKWVVHKKVVEKPL